MDNPVPRITPFIILTMGVTLLLVNNLMSTSFIISDVDPSTYVIVPMLMLIPFSFFMYKTNIKPHVKRNDLIVGALAFALFLLGTSYIRFVLPLSAESFKSDFILFPLAIGAFTTLLFGFRNVHRFWPLMLYSIFASPAILMFVFSLNLQFASLNTQIVYSVLHVLYKSVSYIAPITINFNGSLIGIGEACAGIGALIAMVMFLLPVAYFYDGKGTQKLYWVVSGVLLLFILNLFRMFSISALWIYYGLAAAASFIHIFAGILLFYLSIIIIVIIANRYKIHFPIQKEKPKADKSTMQTNTIFGYASVIMLGLIYIYASSAYVNLPNVSPLAFQQINLNGITGRADTSSISNIISNSTKSNYTVNIEPVANGSAFALLATNQTFSYADPIVVLLASNSNYTYPLLNNNLLVSANYYVDPHGNTVALYDLESQGHEFYIAYAPIITGSTLGNVDILYAYVIMPANPAILNQRCRLNLLDSDMASLFSGFKHAESNLYAQFCISDRFIMSAN